MDFYWHKPGTADWETPFAVRPTYGIPAGDFVVLTSQYCGAAAIDNETGNMTIFPGSHFGKGDRKMQLVTLPDAFHTNVPTTAIELPVAAYFDGRLWTLRMRSDELGQSLVLNGADRFDQPLTVSSDARLVFMPSQEQSNSPAIPITVKRPFEVGMNATHQGVIFRVAHTAGLWFMPIEDFDASVAAPVKASK